MTLVRRHTRTVWLVLSVFALGVALALLTSWLTPAQALFCDPNTTLPLPVEPGISTGATLNPATITQNGWTVVAGQLSPIDAYGGKGYDWHSFGQSCLDFSVGTTVGNIMFLIFVSAPAVILGAITQFAFSTTIVNAMLPFVGGGVSDLNDSVFRTWAPMVIAFVLIGVLITIARGRGQKGLGDLSWMVVVILIVGALASPIGPTFLQKVNDTTRNITSCVMFAATAGCSGGDNANSMTIGMVDSISFDTWAAGALGDVADDPMPPSVSYGVRKDPFMVNEDRRIDVPLNAIPARNPGHPTWAETFRWTQTYTHNEMYAMKQNDALRCSTSTSQNIANLSEDNPIKDSDSKTELCGFKWMLRGAMYSHLIDHAPDFYAVAAGQGTDRVAVSFVSAFTVFPIIILLLVLGFMVLIYQVEMLLLFITSPVVALLAMKSKSAGRRWFDMALACLVKWVSAGLVLGLVMMLVDWSGQVMNAIVAGSGGLAILVAVAARGILVLLFVIVAFMMFFKIQKMLLSATGLESASNNGTKGKAVLGAIGLGAVGAAAGAVGAGAGVTAGVRAKAAAMGAARGAMGRSRTGTQYALERAHTAGKRARSQWEDKSEAAPDEDVEGQTPDSGGDKPNGGGPKPGGDKPGSGGSEDPTEDFTVHRNGPWIPPVPAGMEGREDVVDAWEDLVTQPDIQKALEFTPEEQEDITAARAHLDTKTDAVRQARDELDRKMATKIEEALSRARKNIAGGMDPKAAELQALDEVVADPELQQLDEVLRTRRAEVFDADQALQATVPDKVGALVRAMNEKDPAALQVELGLSEDTLEKVTRYRNVAQRAMYDSMPLEESSAPAAALARARAAAEARAEEPAMAGGGGLPNAALQRARHMVGMQQTIVEREVIKEQHGMNERVVRDAIRQGLREGIQGQGSAPAPVAPQQVRAVPQPVQVQQAPPPPPPPPAPLTR